MKLSTQQSQKVCPVDVEIVSADIGVGTDVVGLVVAVEVVAVVGLDLVASCSICCPFINIASLAYGLY